MKTRNLELKGSIRQSISLKIILVPKPILDHYDEQNNYHVISKLLGERFDTTRSNVYEEMASLNKNIAHIKDINLFNKHAHEPGAYLSRLTR